MDDVGCYVAFPDVRDAILIATVLVVVAIFALARWRSMRDANIGNLLPLRRGPVGGHRVNRDQHLTDGAIPSSKSVAS